MAYMFNYLHHQKIRNAIMLLAYFHIASLSMQSYIQSENNRNYILPFHWYPYKRIMSSWKSNEAKASCLHHDTFYTFHLKTWSRRSLLGTSKEGQSNKKYSVSSVPSLEGGAKRRIIIIVIIKHLFKVG